MVVRAAADLPGDPAAPAASAGPPALTPAGKEAARRSPIERLSTQVTESALDYRERFVDVAGNEVVARRDQRLLWALNELLTRKSALEAPRKALTGSC